MGQAAGPELKRLTAVFNSEARSSHFEDSAPTSVTSASLR
jgi:hypothetical protein